MFLRNGLEPWHLLVVALVVILLFGSKKLPDSARSLGKSLRILKSETRALKDQRDGAQRDEAQHDEAQHDEAQHDGAQPHPSAEQQHTPEPDPGPVTAAPAREAASPTSHGRQGP